MLNSIYGKLIYLQKYIKIKVNEYNKKNISAKKRDENFFEKNLSNIISHIVSVLNHSCQLEIFVTYFH